MLKTFKEETGITILTLALTIIIIIILSAVAITVVWGDNGLIKKALETKESVDSSVADTDGKMNKVIDSLINSLIDESEGPPDGSIIFENLTWIGDGTATIVVTSDNLTDSLEYQINSSSGTWTPIGNGDTVGGLHHNDTIYARLVRGSYVGTMANTIIKDEIPPTAGIGLNTSDITHNSVKVTATASDNESGLATTNRYKFYQDNTLKQVSNSNTCTFTGLNPSTKYTFKVIVSDNAGNTTERSISAVTSSDPNLVTNKLREGDYVYYTDGTGKQRKCVVLYGPENANYSSYGIQIVTMDTVETVQLGNGGVSTMIKGDRYFNTARTSYNGAIATLNNKANNYLNTTYASSARSVGSVPNNPTSESGYFTSSYSYMANYNGTLRNKDTNYTTDLNKMTSLKIQNINKDYWLASREVNSNSGVTDFFVCHVVDTGTLTGGYLCGVRLSGQTGRWSAYVNCGLRPVFTLKTNVKVTGGAGTSANPYTLGVFINEPY